MLLEPQVCSRRWNDRSCEGLGPNGPRMLATGGAVRKPAAQGGLAYRYDSFALNDEISLQVYHPGLAERVRLEEDRYMRRSLLPDLEDWARRPPVHEVRLV